MPDFYTRILPGHMWCFQKESFVFSVESLANGTYINLGYRLTSFVRRTPSDSDRIINIHPSPIPSRFFFPRCHDCCSPFTATKLCLFSVAMVTTFFHCHLLARRLSN